MPLIRIDEQTIEARPGDTILQAARDAGIPIPTLCHLDGHDSGASCMVCAVKLKHNGQFIPACASRVVDGMEIEHESAEVREARKMALELLFSDHLGDCLSPCERICPAQLGITTVLKHVRAGELGMAAAAVRRDLPLAGILCRVCNRPCESGCRRGVHDDPVAIADLVTHAIDSEMAAGEARVPALVEDRVERTAIVGSGFTGLSAAWFLRQSGFRCTVIERDGDPAGAIRREFPELSPGFVDAEIRLLESAGVEFRSGCALDRADCIDALLAEFDAVLLATGPDTRDQAVALGLECSGAGDPVVDAYSMMTPRQGLFMAGRAVRANCRPVVAVAEGKAAASCIRRFLTNQEVVRPVKPFSVFMGRVTGGEMEDFLRDANGVERMDCATAERVDLAHAIAESQRCVHCNCAKADVCKLRQLAVDYDVDPRRFDAGARARFSRDSGHPLVNFEPGKCIRCGNCVMVAGDWKEKLGITFVGRGFDVRLGVPFHGSMEEGLRDAAEAAVAACPTGALTMKEGLDPSCLRGAG